MEATVDMGRHRAARRQADERAGRLAAVLRKTRQQLAALVDVMPDTTAVDALWLRFAREQRREGFADGERAGYERAYRELEASWKILADPIAHGDHVKWAELEERRWGPGRAAFGSARAGDFPGRDTTTGGPS